MSSYTTDEMASAAALDELQTLIDDARVEMEAKIAAALHPALQAEFDRVCKREPHLEAILFSNSTFYFDFGDNPPSPDWYGRHAVPKHAQYLWDLANMGIDVIDGKVTPTLFE